MWPLLKAPGPALPLVVALPPGLALAPGGGGGGWVGKKRRRGGLPPTSFFRGELHSVAEAESSQSL